MKAPQLNRPHGIWPLLALVLVLILAGCQTAPERFANEFKDSPRHVHGYPTVLDSGFQTQVIRPEIQKHFEEYLASEAPLAFAISSEGDYSTWWHCPNPKKCDPQAETELRRLSATCVKRVLGEKCFIYAMGDKKVTGAFSEPPFSAPIEPIQLADSVHHTPAFAKGLILYFPGFSGWRGYVNHRPRADSGVGIPILERLNNEGWDINRINISSFRRAMFHDEGGHWKALVNELSRKATAQGYKRIALFGYSRGGSEVLEALAAGASAHAAIVIEPDRLGPSFSATGERKVTVSERVETLSGVLSGQTETPVLLAHFAKSRWYGALEEDAIRSMTEGNEKIIVVERPEGFVSHFAGGSRAFSNAYGDCFAKFVNMPDTVSDCLASEVDPQDQANWSTEADLRSQGVKEVSAEDLVALLSSGSYCQVDARTSMRSVPGTCLSVDGQEFVVSADMSLKEPYEFRATYDLNEGTFCYPDFAGLDFPICRRFFLRDSHIWMVDTVTGYARGPYKNIGEPSKVGAKWTCRARKTRGAPDCVMRGSLGS